METRQKRYEQTEKGRQARQTARIAHRLRRVKWEVWLDAEMSEELEASIPDGVSRSDFVRKIFKKHLDNVCIMQHTEDTEGHKTSNKKKQ